MPRKKRPEGTRAPNGASSIYYSEYDKKWHGRVTMGVKDDGKPDRRHVKRATEGEVIKAVRELEKQRDSGRVSKVGQRWKAKAWFEHWVEKIAAPTVRPTTMVGYRSSVYNHLIPGVGDHWLDRLQPEHLENLYSKMIAGGLKPATAHLVHRTARVALKEAWTRCRYVTDNPALIARPPKVEEEEIEPFNDAEIVKIVRAAANPNRKRRKARFIVALAVGLRRGEALGLRWREIEIQWSHGCGEQSRCRTECAGEDCSKRLGRGRLKVRFGLQQRRWQHGCAGACGTGPARKCPDRHGGGLVLAPVKSRAGRRVVGLAHQICMVFDDHRRLQDADREAAGDQWQDLDLVFTNLTGGPIQFSEDFRAWKQLLHDAGVRDARLHDARHTAATMLLILGVPLPVVMKLMGWSNTAAASRYLHVGGDLVDAVADQVGDRMWGLLGDDDDDGDDDLEEVVIQP
ncbi:tyrosine-type recombinase/integrase [Actinokineospora enzanensis]|uniref:tyrosine-type recombinase/integrase n=1 Tax=Actinokineospora enzanensis TaxID=155975 RepID=UPI0003AA348C|nr:tyrosine-type recombinase/integrase [Actinokineospora enzanensis]